MSDRKKVNSYIYFAIAWFVIIFLQNIWKESSQTETISYSQFENLVEQGQVAEISISEQKIQGTYLTPDTTGALRFQTIRIPVELAEKLSGTQVKYEGIIESTFVSDLISVLLPILILAAVWIFIMRRFTGKQGMGGYMSIGKSKAKVYMEKDTQVTFEDVAGVDEAKEELQEILDFLKSPDQYGRLGARIPKGILLVGPPGTGKTLLARAVAGEAKVPFYSISGSEFVEMFVGVGAARVRDLFEQARKHAPAIIFIDELDALGRARGAFPGAGGNDEREQTLNQLLSELDGFDSSQGLVLLAATNRPEILDPALLRAGRFDRQVLVDRPDKIGRIQILNVHLKKVTLSEDVNPEQIAALTTGFSGADLANLVNEAALLATRRGADIVRLNDFTLAIERIVAGLEKKNKLLNSDEREIVAYHEMGHALVALAKNTSDRVHKVSIIPRGVSALGYTLQRPTEDRFLMTSDELENKIAVLLGGRAAEELTFNHLSTGAADDLAKATGIARDMVMRFGMDKKLGSVTYDRQSSGFLDTERAFNQKQEFSEETAREIDMSVRDIIKAGLDQARQVLEMNKPILTLCAKKLLQVETLNEADLRKLTKELR